MGQKGSGVFKKGEHMRLKLGDAIGSMDYHDLVDLNIDLQGGGHATRQLVEQRIKDKEKEMGKLCQVCQSEIDPHSTSNYTILLGPEGLRRKASFCALDCMKYFISTLEARKEEQAKKAHLEVKHE
jgi:hypothetical protein